MAFRSVFTNMTHWVMAPTIRKLNSPTTLVHNFVHCLSYLLTLRQANRCLKQRSCTSSINKELKANVASTFEETFEGNKGLVWNILISLLRKKRTRTTKRTHQVSYNLRFWSPGDCLHDLTCLTKLKYVHYKLRLNAWRNYSRLFNRFYVHACVHRYKAS